MVFQTMSMVNVANNLFVKCDSPRGNKIGNYFTDCPT